MREKHTLLDDGKVKVEIFGHNELSGEPFNIHIYDSVESYIVCMAYDMNCWRCQKERYDLVPNDEEMKRIRKEEKAKRKAETTMLTA